jgi:hypothetical protein
MLSLLGSLVGGLLGRSAQDRANDANIYAAQNQVRWRVADAQAAGINPLAALGMSPVGPIAQPVTALGDAVGAGVRDYAARRSAARSERLAEDLLRSQIRATDAQTLDTLAQAQSRSVNQAARAAAIGGAAPTLNVVSDPLGGSYVVDPRTTAAGEIGSQYGMIAMEAHGFPSWIRDGALSWSDPLGERFSDPVRPRRRPGGLGRAILPSRFSTRR